jgi:acetate kinase
MGLTPLAGVPMGTRSGDIDPAIVEFVAQKEGLDLAGVMSVLNKKSGMLGVSGKSSDFRDLDDAAEKGNKLAKLALSAYCYRVAKYIGSYAIAMQGVDVIAFTAGIGENSAGVRADVCSYLGFLGAVVNEEANKVRGEEKVITEPESKVTVMVVPTNEELSIARQTLALL